MADLRVRCEGFQVGRLIVPPFQLRRGDMVCLHVPPDYGEENEQLITVLSSGRDTAALHFAGRVAWVSRPIPQRGFLWRRRNPRCVDWLIRSAELTESQAASVLRRLQLPPDVRIGYLSGDPKLLVGLEAVLTRGADIVVFDTVGASPYAIQKAHDALAARSGDCAVLQMSCGYEKWRVCAPSARCIALMPMNQDMARSA